MCAPAVGRQFSPIPGEAHPTCAPILRSIACSRSSRSLAIPPNPSTAKTRKTDELPQRYATCTLEPPVAAYRSPHSHPADFKRLFGVKTTRVSSYPESKVTGAQQGQINSSSKHLVIGPWIPNKKDKISASAAIKAVTRK